MSWVLVLDQAMLGVNGPFTPSVYFRVMHWKPKWLIGFYFDVDSLGICQLAARVYSQDSNSAR